MRNRKLGWGEITCGIEQVGGREVYFERAHLELRAESFGKTIEMKILGESRYATTGTGEQLYYRLDSQRGTRERETVTVVRKADGWHLLRTYQSAKTRKPPLRKVLPVIRSNLTNGEHAYAAALATGTLKVGDKYRYLGFDEDDLKDHDYALQVLAVGKRHLRGVDVTIHKLETLSFHDKIRGEGLHDRRGRLLEGSFMRFLRIKREEKATAKRMGAKAVDFGLGLMIPAKMEGVKDPARVRQMRLELRGYLPEVVAKHPRHTLTQLGTGRALLTVTRESLKGLTEQPLPVRDAKLAEHLRATHNIEVKHPEIRALARRAAGSAKTTLAAARAINRFVYRHLKKTLSTDLDSALAIARVRSGDCTEHSRLMVALCRAIGLPAREVGGITYVPALAGFGYHAWVEVYVGGGRWVSADPSWDELPVNATHIWLGWSRDSRWMGTLGTLKARVLETKLR